ncbi:hypothetical protein DOTSEDRAFT_27783 [Dothistroma septosporum NZE10]|uniref:AB hydrolase-1 domain-containing protein n=1 Tax=Dothistroma septosporum (strain NZE10 / CBS 128990) TaxID=675120 RepID=N1PCR3_DOTSN|nr:hypothetical protein DOTSEDRAFT_27783 [Dothistroma septosporum NZE10]
MMIQQDNRQHSRWLGNHAPAQVHERFGTLSWNPGGPGLSSISDMSLGRAFSPYIIRHFDLVAMNVRGLDNIEPAHYNMTLSLKPFNSPPVLQTEEAFHKHVADRMLLARSCTDGTGNASNYECAPDSMTVVNVAKDFEIARQLVGDDKVTSAGFSWGSVIAATYAELFPSKMRTLVLDGVLHRWPQDLTDATSSRCTAQNVEDY